MSINFTSQKERPFVPRSVARIGFIVLHCTQLSRNKQSVNSKFRKKFSPINKRLKSKLILRELYILKDLRFRKTDLVLIYFKNSLHSKSCSNYVYAIIRLLCGHRI